MNACDRMRPVLFRVAEGETAPDEAILAARHLSDCTACRIALARERRLAQMLEADLPDRLPVGEDFVRTVMANLPSEPPPRPRLRARRWLKLAGWTAVLTAGPWLAERLGGSFGGAGVSPALPRLEVPGLEGGPETLLGVGSLLRTTVGVLATWLPAFSRALPTGTEFAALLLLPVVAGLAAIAVLAAVATPRLIRRAGP